MRVILYQCVIDRTYTSFPWLLPYLLPATFARFSRTREYLICYCTVFTTLLRRVQTWRHVHAYIAPVHVFIRFPGECWRLNEGICSSQFKPRSEGTLTSKRFTLVALAANLCCIIPFRRPYEYTPGFRPVRRQPRPRAGDIILQPESSPESARSRGRQAWQRSVEQQHHSVERRHHSMELLSPRQERARSREKRAVPTPRAMGVGEAWLERPTKEGARRELRNRGDTFWPKRSGQRAPQLKNYQVQLECRTPSGGFQSCNKCS